MGSYHRLQDHSVDLLLMEGNVIDDQLFMGSTVSVDLLLMESTVIVDLISMGSYQILQVHSVEKIVDGNYGVNQRLMGSTVLYLNVDLILMGRTLEYYRHTELPFF
ncbi:hypothetical protein DPMN_049826 [Dreissena polymorpha]|uniref:Uncharacterized protein n=1 Tax=Dreissena polymorpha TaxID=45954 RepID=A0A9D4CF07_DREPO|nr:hypothetical protein DPMN_049826 [Dreissena polymorpha]